MDSKDLKRKTRWTWVGIRVALRMLLVDLWRYYVSPYPFLRAPGAFRRIYRRLRAIWLPKPKGRPPLTEEMVHLILDMKSSNLGWGALTISNELKAMGINVCKKTVESKDLI
jgi:hypothetical protein